MSFLRNAKLAVWERSAYLRRLALCHDWTAVSVDAGRIKESNRNASVLAVFGSGGNSFQLFAMQQALCLLQQRVASSHPFIAYLQDALGHVGDELVSAFYHRNDKKLSPEHSTKAWVDSIAASGWCEKACRLKKSTTPASRLPCPM